MGIPLLYKYLYNRYKETVTRLNEGETSKFKIDEFLFDLNAVIHTAIADYFKEMGHKKKHKPSKDSFKIYDHICSHIESRVQIIKPTKRIFFAIDGVCGRAKQNQQKQRRFLSLKKKKSSEFDTNSISVGTRFMYGFSKHLKGFVTLKLKKEWKGLSIIISNERAVMEGEHKLLKYIRMRTLEDRNVSICVDSPDADLIVLLSTIKFHPLYLFKNNLYNNIDAKYLITNISHLNNMIMNEMKWTIKEPTRFKEANLELALTDMIFTLSFLGNDFLPKIPSLHIIKKESFMTLIEKSKETAKENNYITKPDFEVDFQALLLFFKKMSSLETEDPQVYYIANNISDLDQMCLKYIEGLIYVMKYYLKEIPDWDWLYPFNYAPYFSSLYNYLRDNLEQVSKIKFTYNKPIQPIEQLLSILPPQSADLLPESLRSLIRDSGSPIKYLYPDEFEVDEGDSKFESDWKALIPPIDGKAIHEAFIKNMKFTDEEKKRNTIEQTHIYKASGIIKEHPKQQMLIPPTYESYTNPATNFNLKPYPIFMEEPTTIDKSSEIEVKKLKIS